MTQTMFIAGESGLLEVKLGAVTVHFAVREGDEVLLKSEGSWRRCAKCNGSGFLVRGAVYCECPLGKDLMRIETGPSSRLEPSV